MKIYQMKTILRLRSLESGAFDASDFMKWQSEMRRMDLEAEMAGVEERRLKGKLSHEEAILAQANLMAENQNKVAEIKEQVNGYDYRNVYPFSKSFYFAFTKDCKNWHVVGKRPN